MAFCQLVFPILVLCVVNSIATSGEPVFMWSSSNDVLSHTKANPLRTISSEEFKEIVKTPTESNQLVLVFLEETLSIEDFSLKYGIANGRETPFDYLQSQLDNSLYLPSVDNPLKTLENLGESKKIDHIVLNENGLSRPIVPESADILFINLKDAREGESRVDLLQRHDAFIKDTLDNLEIKNVLAVYTGRNPSWVIPEEHSRVRREVAAGQRQSLSFNYLLMDVSNVTLRTENQVVTLSELTSNNTEHNDTTLSVAMNFENYEIILNFFSSRGYWHFENVVLSQTSPESFTEELQPKSEIYALHGFAYRCAQEVVFASVNNSRMANITFSDLKIQAFFDTNGTASLLTYGDSFNCVGFFSVPIWSGLFVVFILLSITFYGIMMMMDIRTMDRFDDPKGKTITINAGE